MNDAPYPSVKTLLLYTVLYLFLDAILRVLVNLHAPVFLLYSDLLMHSVNTCMLHHSKIWHSLFSPSVVLVAATYLYGAIAFRY